MRSGALCCFDVESSCLEEKQRWTSGVVKDIQGIWDKHTPGRCHGGLPQPAQEGLHQLSSEEEQHVRWYPCCRSVCECVCVRLWLEKKTCKCRDAQIVDQVDQFRPSALEIVFALCVCVSSVCPCWSVGERKLKANTGTLMFPKKPRELPRWTESTSVHQAAHHIATVAMLVWILFTYSNEQVSHQTAEHTATAAVLVCLFKSTESWRSHRARREWYSWCH